MKKILSVMLAFCMLFVFTACGNSPAMDESDTPEDIAIPLGDTGATVVIPAEMGFETYQSEINDFYGGGPNGEWRIIANTDLKADYEGYTFAEFVENTALANNGTAAQDDNGNYYFTYENSGNDGQKYKFYTAVREGETEYYRVSFYCFANLWDYYSVKFADWAATIEVK